MNTKLTRSFFLFFIASVLARPALAAAPLTFSVTFDEATRREPATGRLVVYLVRSDAPVSPNRPPAEGFIEESPQPLFGMDVQQWLPGTAAIIDDAATAFPVALSKLPPGKYRTQAVLDLAHANSSFRREPGNLYSDVVTFETSAVTEPVKLSLARVVKATPDVSSKNVQFVTVRSKLLSDFRGADVFLRAGIALPVDYDPNRAYPAVYEVPGYGGDHLMALYKSMRRFQRERGSEADEIAHNTFWIFLDPESPNGHTLLADSDNNGPCGKALITELIPAIEEKFKMIRDPSARIITGHSSGGWSSIWLATEYPETFGACWSSSPDPIDFRKFELVDIYSFSSLYVDLAGNEISSARFGGKSTMTTRQENGMEQVLGTRNDSAQQWDSWQACWGHRHADGGIKPLYDAIRGDIDHAEAESYRRYDIVDRLRKDPKRFVPIFRNNIRIICGTEDNYYLNEAVALLKADLDQLDPPPANDDRPGYVKLVPGDHGSVMGQPDAQAAAAEMMAHLRKFKHVAPTTNPTPSPSGRG